jgi:predicted AAA+ superfamily ATPase
MAKYLARLVSSAPLVFLICINDLPKIPLKINLNGSYKIILFADDMSLNVNNPNYNVFKNYIKMIFKKIINGLILTCSR